MQKIITTNSTATKALGAKIAKQIKHGGIVCLTGDLGAGKTTFTQGLLKALKVKGPYTSPTFLIMKNYRITHSANRKSRSEKDNSLHDPRSTIREVYHVDAYRIKNKDLLNLGWKEMTDNLENIIIIEWADRVKKIIPKNSFWINLEWLTEKERKITILKK